MIHFSLLFFIALMLVSCDKEEPIPSNMNVVSFDVYTGYSMADVLVEDDATLLLPEAPTRDGYVCAGWYKDSERTRLYDFNLETVGENMTLYAKWKAETDFTQTFKILSIGNSFSEDAHRYLWSIAESYGVPEENIVIANMYIGGAPLATHAANVVSHDAAYEYQLYESATISRTYNVSLDDAIANEDWDVITFQQASNFSGLPSSYADYVNRLIGFVDRYATNPNVQIMWHMTWAYQQTSTHSGFLNYDRDQTTMYQAIISTVQERILTLSQINSVIPSGTAIQNTRSSFVGDTLTRDGYHLSDPLGRYIAGLMFFKTITGFEVSPTSIPFMPAGITAQLQQLAIESVNNANLEPYQVTQSSFTTAT